MRPAVIAKSSFYKIWLVAFILMMGYQLYWVHGEGVALSSHSFFVGILSGIAIYLLGVYKLKIEPTNEWGYAVAAISVALVMAVLSALVLLFVPKLAGGAVVATWFCSLFIDRPSNA
ncbi:hypothetical protein [Marinobacter sp. CA1]|uniref:hypothetical protein n=1 Tax=Marinobacter sp. CA1 TaxID=2817656 RepID=UPI001D067812|nr:hypothetical protein [Marinobacter sp. CA1]UDL05987.1 hypothetical protein J2887_04260 [Marinobacter sp. CA1]